jgi:8-oxo-dGTP pyrophosphatase MutT (NUDIX family)
LSTDTVEVTRTSAASGVPAPAEAVTDPVLDGIGNAPEAALPTGDLYVPFGADPNAEMVWAEERTPHGLQLWRHPRSTPGGRKFNHYRLTGADDRPGVAVLPITDDGRIGLLHIWRPVVSDWVWEIPRGGAETDDPVDDARRELLEETGLHAVDLVHVGAVHPDSGIISDKANIVIALIRDAPADIAAIEAAEDNFEIHEFLLLPRHEINKRIRAGEITDSYTLSALAFLDAALD